MGLKAKRMSLIASASSSERKIARLSVKPFRIGASESGVERVWCEKWVELTESIRSSVGLVDALDVAPAEENQQLRNGVREGRRGMGS